MVPGTKQELQGILDFLLAEGTGEPWQKKASFPSLGGTGNRWAQGLKGADLKMAWQKVGTKTT